MSQIQQVKAAVDLIEIISERLDLKRSGRNWRGLCPFHSEKTPSFFVSEEMQRYKCFGCGEAGDVFTFLEKYEGMTFSEALEYLAERAGITLQDYRPTAADAERVKLLEILDLAKEYYHFLLTEHEVGQPGRDYMKQRGINQETAKLFQLGYAMPKWDGLVKYLHLKKKYDQELLVRSGLVINSRGRYYDRFRGRLMFPLKNHRGQVVGFSGRILDKAAKEAKYINTPETELYHKAELLFGYSELLQFIRKQNKVVVVEGELDVISSAQAHVNNIVAVKGSAFTEHHARYIKRVADQVLFALDMDQAGVTATKRAIPIAQAAGLELRVITLGQIGGEGAKDPDELAKENPKAWREATRTSISAYQFLMDAALAAHDPSTPEGKREIIKELAEPLAEIAHEVEKDFYVKQLASLLKVKPAVVEQDIYQHGQAPAKKKSRSRSQENATEPEDSRQAKLERYSWFLLLHSQPELMKERLKKLSQLEFYDHRLELIAAKLAAVVAPPSLEVWSQTLPEDLQELLLDLYLQPQYQQIKDETEIDEEWQKTWPTVQAAQIQRQIAQITAELDALDQKDTKTEAEEKQVQEYLEKIVMLRGKIK